MRSPFKIFLTRGVTLLFFSFFVSFTHAQVETTPLIKAIDANNLDEVKKLIANGAEVNEMDDLFQTPIEIAVLSGQLDIVKFLVESGAEDRSTISEAVKLGNMPMTVYLIENGFSIGEAIVYAVEANDLKMVTYLAENGADVNFSQKRKTGLFKKHYVSPIGEAIALNNLELIQLLIKHGVTQKDALQTALSYGKTDLVFTLSKDFDDKNWLLIEAFSVDNQEVVSALFKLGVLPNVQDENGNSLLLLAARSGNLTRVQTCVELYKLDIHHKNGTGENALMKAAEVGSVAICEYLLTKGISINAENAKGETALFYALTTDTRLAFDFLLKQGADIQHTTSDGNSLLMKCAQERNDDMMNYLISLGVNLHHKNNSDQTAFYYVVSNASGFSSNELLENTFISAGSPIDTRGNDGETLLFKAVEGNRLERVQFLVEKGANATITNEKGERPTCENFALIRYLIEHGADINAVDDWNNTFLCVAVDENDLELAYYLIDKQIDVNQNCYFEEPAIIKAVKEENLTLVKFIAENGANVNAIGYFERNVMDYAQEIENQAIIDYLRSRGALTKEDRNAQFERSIKVESEIKSALIAEDLDRIVALMAQHEVIILQEKTVQDLAYVAAKKAHTPMINKLLSNDVDFEIDSPVNEQQQTLLTIATIYSQDNLILDLLAKGANSTLLDGNNKQPADYATKNSTEKIYKNWANNR